MVDLSVIIISFNTKRLLKDCLDSILKNTRKIAFEIIVIDNASTDGSVLMLEKLKKLKPQKLKLIKNKDNLGFAKANNQGMKIAKGRFVLLLNSDTVINDNVLGEMVDWMSKNKKVGIASCALKNPDGSLQGTGGYFPTLFRVFAWMFFIEDIPIIDKLIKPFHPMHPRSFIYKGVGNFKKIQLRDWVSGTFFLIRRDILGKVGFIDEDYFMYVEEVDYCYRVKKTGWQVWYLPQWSVIHIGGASSPSEFPIISEFKGIKTFFSKHQPDWQFSILRFLLKMGALLRLMVFKLLGPKDLVQAYAKAYKII